MDFNEWTDDDGFTHLVSAEKNEFKKFMEEICEKNKSYLDIKKRDTLKLENPDDFYSHEFPIWQNIHANVKKIVLDGLTFQDTIERYLLYDIDVNLDHINYIEIKLQDVNVNFRNPHLMTIRPKILKMTGETLCERLNLIGFNKYQTFEIIFSYREEYLDKIPKKFNITFKKTRSQDHSSLIKTDIKIHCWIEPKKKDVQLRIRGFCENMFLTHHYKLDNLELLCNNNLRTSISKDNPYLGVIPFHWIDTVKISCPSLQEKNEIILYVTQLNRLNVSNGIWWMGYSF